MQDANKLTIPALTCFHVCTSYGVLTKQQIVSPRLSKKVECTRDTNGPFPPVPMNRYKQVKGPISTSEDHVRSGRSKASPAARVPRNRAADVIHSKPLNYVCTSTRKLTGRSLDRSHRMVVS